MSIALLLLLIFAVVFAVMTMIDLCQSDTNRATNGFILALLLVGIITLVVKLGT